MKKVISFLFGMAAIFFFIKSAFLSTLYLYKTGGVLLCLLGLFAWPFMVVAVPWLAGLQQGVWAPMINGLMVFPCIILAGLLSNGK